MAFNIPIQERDGVQLEQGSLPQIQNKQIVQPIQGDTGARLDKLADVMDAKSKEIKKQMHQFAKMDFENQLNQTVDAQVIEAVNAKGENAFVASDRANKKIKEQTSKLLQNVNEEFRGEFTLDAGQKIAKANSTLLGHQYKEKNAVEEASAKQLAEYSTNQMAASTYLPDQYEDNKKKLSNVVEIDIRRKLGITTDLNVEPSAKVKASIEVHKFHAVSAGHTQAISLMASNEDVTGAKDMLNKYAEELTPTDRMKVNAALSKGKANEKASAAKRLMEEAMSFSKNPREAMAYIQKGTADGEIFNLARSMYETQVNFAETQRKRDLEKSQAWAQEQIRKVNGNPAAVTEIIKKLPLEDRDKMWEYSNKVSQGETIPRDSVEYNSLMNMYQTYPSKFAEVNLESKNHLLPKDDIDFFRARQKELQDPALGKISFDSLKDTVKRVVSVKSISKGGYNSREYLDSKAAIYALAGKIHEEMQVTQKDRLSKSQYEVMFENELNLRSAELFKTEEGKLWFADKVVLKPTEEVPVVPQQTTQFRDYNPALVERVRTDLTKQKRRPPTLVEIGEKLKELNYQSKNN